MASMRPRMVRFLVGDLVYPPPAQALLRMFADQDVEGEVTQETTAGEVPYLVVRVPGVSEAVIVPRDKTQPVSPTVPPV